MTAVVAGVGTAAAGAVVAAEVAVVAVAADSAALFREHPARRGRRVEKSTEGDGAPIPRRR